MAKLAVLLASASFVLFLMPATAMGQVNFFNGCDTATQTEFCKQAQDEKNHNRITGPNGILTRGVTYVTFVGGAISVIVVIVGGLRYILSGGDPNGTKQAKDTILYALIGLTISIFSYVIVGFVVAHI